MDQKNIKTIRSGYDLFAQGDFARLPFDPQIEWIEPQVEGLPWGGMHHGPEAVIKEVFRSVLDRFENFHLQCDEFLSAGEPGDRYRVVFGAGKGHRRRIGREIRPCLDVA